MHPTLLNINKNRLLYYLYVLFPVYYNDIFWVILIWAVEELFHIIPDDIIINFWILIMKQLSIKSTNKP